MISMVRIFALVFSLVGAAAPSHANEYPTRPVRVIVGFPAGGPTDIVARIIAQSLSERLGQQFIVENRPGAGSNIATQAVITSPPDGYTLLLVSPPHAINATLYRKLPYNFLEDIVPVAGLANGPNVMEVHPSVPAKTVAEFIEYAKANPGKVSFASAGNGTTIHLSGELFMAMTGVKMQHVPYRGSAPALTDMISGQVQVMFDNVFVVDRAPAVRRVAAARRDVARAAGDAARCADARRDRAGLRDRHLVGHRRAEGDAGRHRREAQPRDQRDPRRAEDQGALRRARLRAAGHVARRVRQIPRRRDREMGEGGEVLRRAGG